MIYTIHLVCEGLEFSLHLVVFDTMAAYLSIRKNADIVAIKGTLNQLRDLSKHLLLCALRGEDLVKLEVIVPTGS